MKKSWLILALPMSFLAFLAFALVLQETAAATAFDSHSEPRHAAAVRQRIAETGEAHAIILLRTTSASAAGTSPEIAAAQQELLAALAATGFQLHHRYRAIPALAGRLTASALRAVQEHPLVTDVYLDEPGSGHLGESVPALRADELHTEFGLTGAGVRVALLDSGVDRDHQDLAGAIVAEQCFTHGDCSPYGTNTGGSAEDEQGHGTNVAGIITGDGLIAPVGVAPDASLVNVRVLDSNNAGWVSDWVAGLDWLIANQATLQIDLVNMSLGTWALYTANCDQQRPALAEAVARLNALGVGVFASSGNQGSTNAISAPACLSNVVAVAATYDAELGRQPGWGTYEEQFGSSWPACADEGATPDTIACFSNHSHMVDVAAPGARLTAAGLGGGRATFVGTSMATAAVTGVAALLRQAEPGISPAMIETLLEQNGTLVRNPRNGLILPRVDALRAARPLLPVSPVAASIDGARRGSTGHAVALTATVFPLSSTQPLTYLWQAVGQSPVTHSGGPGDIVTFTWFTTGTYPISLTVSNAAGRVTETHIVTQASVGMGDLAILGPTTGSSGVPQLFTAVATPPTASLPITYHWTATGQSPLTRSASAADVAPFTWASPGRYTLTVTATNAMSTLTATRVVTVVDVAPLTVTLAGPALGATGFAYSVVAAVAPLTASRPLTYAWTAAGQMPITHTAGPLDGITFTWETPGRYTVAVTATNRAGSVSQQLAIDVVDMEHFYLPLSRNKE